MRILITTFGTAGDVNPYVALAHALAARGHEPVIATHAWYRDAIEREGLEHRPVRPDAEPENRALFARALDPRRGSEVVIREILMARLRESYVDTSAAAAGVDLIVTHPITFAGPIVAEERGLAWISTVLAPASFFSRHDIPVFPPAPWAKRLEHVPGVPWLLDKAGRAMTREWIEPAVRLREEIGLPLGRHPIFEGQHAPRGALALFSRVLARPQPDWPPSVHLTGFLFRHRAADDDAGSERLGAFLEAGPPPVVFTLGSSVAAIADSSFYDASVAAARRLGVRAVLLLGPLGPPGASEPAGNDVLVIDQAPHEGLFPRAAAIVHHGGIGTLAQGLRAGRPMLIVPHAHDQPDNAWRAGRLGVARILYPKRYQADRVAEELRSLLEDSVYAERAEAVSRIVRSEDGVATACNAIEAAMGSAVNG